MLLAERGKRLCGGLETNHGKMRSIQSARSRKRIPQIAGHVKLLKLDQHVLLRSELLEKSTVVGFTIIQAFQMLHCSLEIFSYLQEVNIH